MGLRKREETEFHNKAFREGTRAEAWKFYTVVRSSRAYYEQLLQSHSSNKDVLEYGSGRGNYISLLSQRGAAVTAVDVACVAIKRSRDLAEREQLDRVSFCVADAESLVFSDNAFDLVCGAGILHHLNLDVAYSELARILTPEGRAIFIEPMGHNPIINLYRKLTPHLRTVDEHPLLMEDLKLAQSCFGNIETHFFHLNSLLAVPFRELPGFLHLLGALDALDKALFSYVLPARKYAWQVVIVLSQPNT